MATMIGNAAESVPRSLRPEIEKPRSGGATVRDLASDEQAFTAALEGGSARAAKGSQEPGAMQAGEPKPADPSALKQSTGERGVLPTAQLADILSIASQAAMPTTQPARSDPLIPALSSKRAGEPISNAGPEPAALQPQTPPQPIFGLAKDASASSAEAAYLPSTTDSEPARQPVESEPAGDKSDPSENPAFALGDAILRSLQGKAAPESAVPAPLTATDDGLGQIAEKVASRILVADRSTGAPEVRITLDESVLNGAEVRIRRAEGQVIVEFTPSSTDSQSLLHERRDSLQNALKERLGDDVRVEIRTQDAVRENRDGRSRQRRSVWDERDSEE